MTLVRRQTVGAMTFRARTSSTVEFDDDLGTTVVSIISPPGGLERVVLRSNVRAVAHAAQFFPLTLQR